MSERNVVDTLHWLAELAPVRLTGTPAEREAQDAIAARLEEAGYEAERQPFRFSRHIYGSLALHFGLAWALVWVATFQPYVAAAGHLVVALSFFSEAVWRRHLLRLLWPRIDTQNLKMTRAADGDLKRRVVLLAHVDSAFTGFMFSPGVLKHFAKPAPSFLPFLKKQLFLPFFCLLVFAGLEAAALEVPSYVRALLSVPFALVFLLNADIVIRNTVVPGAADNLSGCAAQVVLAEAWAKDPEPGVEVVFVFTGAEEAGTGGAAHLSRNNDWDPAITEVLVLDTLSNGDLHVLEEGELFSISVPPTLLEAAHGAARDAGQPEPTVYPVPAGATDALPFLVAGFRAMSLTCIDPEMHAPRHYHHPTDTADNVDPVQLEASTRVAEALLRRVARA